MKPILAIAVLLFLSSTAFSQLKLERLPVYTPEEEIIHVVRFPTKHTGYAFKIFGSGMDTLLKTTDGGKSWAPVKLPEENLSLWHFSCIDHNKLCLTAYSLDSSPHPFFYSWDGGQSWVKKYFPPANYFPSIEIVNDSIAYAIVLSELYKTTDTGNTWTKIFEMGAHSQGRSFLNEKTGYLTARDGMIFRTENGGKSWLRQNNFYSENEVLGYYRSPIFYNKDTIFISGWDPSPDGYIYFVLYSFNGGNLWFPRYREEVILDIEMINNKLGYAVGYSEKRETGIIAKTIDFGITWQIFDAKINDGFRNIIMMNDSTAIIHANHGIYRLHLPSLTTSIAEKEPVEKLQLVSYPNPATDVITLETFLSASTNIVLELVDINGKVIDRLDKGRKPQGKYTFLYNIQKLPAGSYIFRLQTGEQVATQKFVILK